MFGLTPAHLLLILIIALVVVGPGKLPEVGAAMGKSIHDFQKATDPLVDPGAAGPAEQALASQAPQPVPVTAYSAPGDPSGSASRQASTKEADH